MSGTMKYVGNVICAVLLAAATMGHCTTAAAQADEPVNLSELYSRIDEAIRQSPQYVAERARKIAACADSLTAAADTEARLMLADRLFRLYKSYRNDSALYYAELCVSLADSLRRPGLSGRYRSLLAYQCSKSDRLAEALEQLRLVDKSALDNDGLVDYYSAWMHVCGEMGTYTQRRGVCHYYFGRQNLYRDSVLMVASEGSGEWYHLKVDILTARRLYQEALALSEQWLRKEPDHTHESAYAAFYRSMVYSSLGNHDQACYWLGKSALDDIKCAVRDQASLLFLAERLADDGDLDRARRYMEFAKACNLAFCQRLRTYQVNSVVSVLEKASQASQSRINMLLVMAGVVIALLLAALLSLYYRLQKRR